MNEKTIEQLKQAPKIRMQQVMAEQVCASCQIQKETKKEEKRGIKCEMSKIQ